MTTRLKDLVEGQLGFKAGSESWQCLYRKFLNFTNINATKRRDSVNFTRLPTDRITTSSIFGSLPKPTKIIQPTHSLFNPAVMHLRVYDLGFHFKMTMWDISTNT